MAVMIEGNDGYKAGVTSDHALKVAEEGGKVAAAKRGDAFAWSWSYNSSANDTVLAIRNDSATKYLIIDKIAITSDAAGEFQVHHADLCTTGTTITGRNLKLGAGAPDATCIEDETANTKGNLLMEIAIEADSTFVDDDVYIVLDNQQVLGIDDLTGSTALTSGYVHGYFESK